MNKLYTQDKIKGIDKLLRSIDLNAYLEAKGFMMVKIEDKPKQVVSL